MSTITTPRMADPVASAAPVEIIVDNAQAEFTGTWTTSTFQPKYYGTDYRVANRSATSTAARVAIWRATVPVAGEYMVSVWLPDGTGDRAPEVKYRVHHAGQITEAVLDHRVTGGVWRYLGGAPLAFTGAGDEFVELRIADVPASTTGSALYVHADAVRVSTPPPPITVAPPGVELVERRNSVEFVWEPLDGAENYIVSRGVDGGALEQVADVRGTAFLDLDFDRGQTKQYTVAGANVMGAGPASDVVTGQLAPGAPLQGVQGLTVTTANDRPVLEWQPARDAAQYQVERAARSGGAFEVVTITAGLSYTDPSPLVASHYRVRSVNAEGAATLTSWQVNWLSPRALKIVVQASTRCVAGKVTIAVRATNNDTVPVAITFESEFGTKSFAAIAPGKNATHTFTTRAAGVPAGAVTVTAQAAIDGVTINATATAPYSAGTC